VTNISTRKDFVSIKTTAETYNAKTVLITPSLGVLKENSEAFSINKQKIEALNCLDFGKAERIVFKILEPLEKKMIENEYIVTTSVGIAHVEIIGNGPRYASVFIPCPLKIDRNSCLLVGIEIAEALTLANRLALVHSSNWSLNPLYLGAYASPIKNGRKWRSILSQPDPPYFFAGEATHEEHFGTVHGAYLSGERAAAQVMAAFTMSP
jgi:monoamine oxidase